MTTISRVWLGAERAALPNFRSADSRRCPLGQTLVNAAAPLSRWVVRRAGLVLIMIGRLLLIGLWIVAKPVFGVDMQEWGRNPRRYGDWTFVEFRNPVTGMYVATRAGTDDTARQATLTLTASPLEGCVASAVVVIDLGAPNPVDLEEFGRIGIEIDDSGVVPAEARFVLPRGDRFEFIEILGPYDTAQLENRRTMAISLGDAQIARFSLKGFASAWGEAQTKCLGFVMR